MLEYRDLNILEDLIADYPYKTIIIQIPDREDINWSKLSKYSGKNILLSLENIRFAVKCKEIRAKFYWAFPVETYTDLRALRNIGVSQIMLGAPLTFDLEVVKEFNIPIRVKANLCYDSFIPRENGIKEFYIRPEDIPLYERYISSIEFYSKNLQQEAGLLKVYKEDKGWDGNLNLLLTNFHYNVDNRLIPEEFAEARIQCGQRCMKNSPCRFCERAVLFSRKIDEKAHS